MAITAWSAKVVTSSICRSVNGMTFFRQTENVPIGVPSRSMGTARIVPARYGGGVSSRKFNVWDVNGFSLQECAPGRSISTWPKRHLAKGYHFFGLHVAIGNPLEKLAIILADVTMLGPDEPHGICNHRIQHRLDFSGRGSNNPQNLPVAVWCSRASVSSDCALEFH